MTLPISPLRSATTPLVLENEFIQVSISTSQNPTVAVRDRRTGFQQTTPLLHAFVMWDALQRSDRANDVELVQTIARGPYTAEFFFRTQRSRIEWSLLLQIDGVCLSALIPWSSIVEGRSSHFRLMELTPLPDLMSGAGTFVVPLKGGALVEPSLNRQAIHDRLLLYGYQPRHEDLPLLPLAGYYEAGRGGIAAIVKDGDCDAIYSYAQPGDGTATAAFALAYRHHWRSPVDPIDREVSYLFLDKTEAHYATIGRLYHHHLQEQEGVSPIAEKIAAFPALGAFSRSMIFKTFHAMKELDRENGDGPFHLHQSFEETIHQLKALKACGIENATIQLVGWNYDGHDGAYPQRFPIDERAGGEAAFRRLIREGQALGYQMQVHDNFVDSVDTQHPGLIRRLWGDPVGRGIWGGGAIYALNPAKIDPAFIDSEMQRVAALGVEGVYYLDAMAPPLEEDYDPDFLKPRRAHAEGLTKLVAKARNTFGACGIEMGFAHLAKHADYVANSPLRGITTSPHDTGTLRAHVTEWVPLWQIAFHGLVTHALLDRPIPALSKVLEGAETGALPRCDFTGANPSSGPIFGVQWHESLLPIFKAKYDILLGSPLRENILSPIVHHQAVGEKAYETTFANGHRVTVDYNSNRIWCDRQEIVIPPLFDQVLPIRTS